MSKATLRRRGRIQFKFFKRQTDFVGVETVGQLGNAQRVKKSFGDELEERARKAISIPRRQESLISQSSLIEDDITLTLHQIERLRARDRDIGRRLLQSECYIATELVQMEDRTPRYSPYRFPEREKMQRRLGHVAEERRRFDISQAEKLDAFHDRLLALLKKHRQLTMT